MKYIFTRDEMIIKGYADRVASKDAVERMAKKGYSDIYIIKSDGNIIIKWTKLSINSFHRKTKKYFHKQREEREKKFLYMIVNKGNEQPSKNKHGIKRVFDDIDKATEYCYKYHKKMKKIEIKGE